MRKYFITSLLINVLLAFTLGYLIHKKVGFSLLLSKVSTVAQGETKLQPHFVDRADLFKSLDSASTGGIVFLGDSLTEGNEWREMFPDMNVKNRGIGGDDTKGVLLRLDELVKLKPNKVFIMLGTNDLDSKDSIEQIASNHDEILNQLSGSQIYVQSVLPINETVLHTNRTNEKVKKLNSLLKQLSVKHNATYLDLYSNFSDEKGQLKKDLTTDGLHLNGKGYGIWKEQIKQYVTE